ncbi:MAG: YhdH/YhfP family quinone oxidoreductase [Bacteroidota bacterium]
MNLPTHYLGLRVEETEAGKFSRSIKDLPLAELPSFEDEVTIRVHYAALNYKDGLSATGNKGVTRNYPHTPGIDASGVVVASKHPDFQEGMSVICTSYDLGMNTSGAFAEYIRVPGSWVIPMPQGYDLRESMVQGTAGLTAGLGLYQMERMGQNPDMGPLLVTGASGGVGSLAVAIFSQAGYDVWAVTGSADAHDYLRGLGAKEILARDEVIDTSGRPILKARWAGALDTVGGDMLASVIKGTKSYGNVAVCGLVASPKFDASVFPFILRGVNVLGVESAEHPMAVRKAVWDKLATSWRVPMVEGMYTETDLDTLSEAYIPAILEGKTKGRVLAKLV